MGKTWIVLDSNYLCHRARYSMGELSYQGISTGVVYGFLKDVFHFRTHFQTQNIIFCWDYGYGIRKSMYKKYKSGRSKKEYTEEEITFENHFKKQMKRLRVTYLSAIGFKNIFFQKGYEADDLIASVCHNNIQPEDSAIIVSADHDLYQLLSKNISIYHPQKKQLITEEGFIKEFKIQPDQWPLVKALAGCSSDNVKGIDGVGEKTAIKFIRNELNENTATWKKIETNKKRRLAKNLPLVKLPLEGTNVFELQKDRLSKKGWISVCRKLGIKSIKNDFFKDKRTDNVLDETLC